MASGVIRPKEPQAGGSSSAADGVQAEESPRLSAGGQGRGRFGGVVLSLVIAGVLLVLGFSPLSRLAAHGLPQAPGGRAPLIAGLQSGKTTAVQAVPAGLPKGARIRTVGDVFPYAVAALGKSDAQALMAVLKSKSSLAASVAGTSGGGVEYPYRYPPLEAVLDHAPSARFASRATALGAALTVLAAQPQSASTPQPAEMAIINAAPAAYGVLTRVGAAGGCAPQLDLLLLLAADQDTDPGTLS